MIYLHALTSSGSRRTSRAECSLGAPPAADARVQGAERAEQVVREAGLGGNDDDDDAFNY